MSTQDAFDQLKSSLAAFAPVFDAAKQYVKLQEKERRKQEKANPAKVTEFEGFVRRIKWAEIRRPQMINRIFDNNHIDIEEKGYLMLEMAAAFKRVIPEYKNTPIKDVMDYVSQWIWWANKERPITKEGGSKIHPSEHEGHYKFRWYVTKWEGDFTKQQEHLKGRVQSAEKTLENREIEWEEYQRISTEPEKEQLPELQVPAQQAANGGSA